MKLFFKKTVFIKYITITNKEGHDHMLWCVCVCVFKTNLDKEGLEFGKVLEDAEWRGI